MDGVKVQIFWYYGVSLINSKKTIYFREFLKKGRRVGQFADLRAEPRQKRWRLYFEGELTPQCTLWHKKLDANLRHKYINSTGLMLECKKS